MSEVSLRPPPPPTEKPKSFFISFQPGSDQRPTTTTTMGSSTFGIIHHGGLLLLPLGVISVILAVVVAFVSSASALPSPQALFPADDHQIIHHGKPKDVRIPCNFNGVSYLFFSFPIIILFFVFFFFFTSARQQIAHENEKAQRGKKVLG